MSLTLLLVLKHFPSYWVDLSSLVMRTFAFSRKLSVKKIFYFKDNLLFVLFLNETQNSLLAF